MKDKERIIEMCKNIQRTLDKEINETCTRYSNSMFNKPIVSKSMLKRKLDRLIKKYDITEF